MKKTGWCIAGILVGAVYFGAGLAGNLNASASLTAPNPADIHATAGKMTTEGMPIDIAKLQSGQQTLRVGHYNQLPPFYYADDNPQPGFGYEVFSEVAKKAGFQKVKFIGFDNNIDLNMQLAAGNIDVIANSWDLPGMRQQFLLTTPYYTKGGLGFLYFKQKGSYQTVDDLKNATIGVFEHGYADRYWLPSHGVDKSSIKAYSSIRELMFALKYGNVDVALVYYPLAQLAEQQLADQLASTLVQPISDVYAVRKQDEALQKALNQAIQSLATDGTIAKLQAQYLNPTTAAAQAPSPPV
jgi:ABC-type amino acid transport substrate-binding protein